MDELIGYYDEDLDDIGLEELDYILGDDYDEYDDDVGDDELVGADPIDYLGIMGAIEGDYDDEGDDVDDIGDEIGRRRRRRRRGRRPPPRRRSSGGRRARARAIRAARAAQAMATRKRASRGLSTTRTRQELGRQIFFGGELSAPATGSLVVSTTVQELCKVTRLYLSATTPGPPIAVVPPEIYAVQDIKVGVKSQFTALVAVPATSLST